MINGASRVLQSGDFKEDISWICRFVDCWNSFGKSQKKFGCVSDSKAKPTTNYLNLINRHLKWTKKPTVELDEGHVAVIFTLSLFASMNKQNCNNSSLVKYYPN